jgi:hypothetical protein
VCIVGYVVIQRASESHQFEVIDLVQSLTVALKGVEVTSEVAFNVFRVSAVSLATEMNGGRQTGERKTIPEHHHTKELEFVGFEPLNAWRPTVHIALVPKV